MFEKILLVNPPYIYIGVQESVSNVSITIALGALASMAREVGIDVRILDLNLEKDISPKLETTLEDFQPDIVGITFTTPLFHLMNTIAKKSKDFNEKIVVIAGGAHATAMPQETLENSYLDAVAIGEAEITFLEFIRGCDWDSILGLAFKRNGEVHVNPYRPLITNLDALPFPALDLFEIPKYIYPPTSCRTNPVGLMETSRGCYARCTFCNKNIFGYKIRCKSSKRVVDEMEYLLNLGFKEIHFADDLFTANMRNAKAVCKEILSRGLDFPWVPRSGIRVDRVDRELLTLMLKAGCYHVPFGIESGNQEILDAIGKGITLEEVENAVYLAKEVGMETTGYFMIGLPGETEETIQETVEFALKLDLDHVKFGVTVPLPGTPLYNDWRERGLLKTSDWSKYTYSTPPWEIYNHPTLSKEVLERCFFAGNNILEIANKTVHKTGLVEG